MTAAHPFLAGKCWLSFLPLSKKVAIVTSNVCSEIILGLQQHDMAATSDGVCTITTSQLRFGVRPVAIGVLPHSCDTRPCSNASSALQSCDDVLLFLLHLA